MQYIQVVPYLVFNDTVEPWHRSAKGAVKLYCYVEESLYRNSRYNNNNYGCKITKKLYHYLGVKESKLLKLRELLNGKEGKKHKADREA